MKIFEIAQGPNASRPRSVAQTGGHGGQPAGAAPCVLSTYLRTLLPTAAPASDECFAAFYSALQRLVRRQLIRRGLWGSPPRFVGVAGGERWSAEAVDELAADALIHLLERARSLHHHLEDKAAIDGLVRLEIEHFISERQRRADPLGYRLYSVVHEAVGLAIRAGDLEVFEGGPRVTNRTVLGPEDPTLATASDHSDELESAARQWADDLLPELVTGWGKRRARVVRELAERLATVGVGAFSFKELLDAIKRAVRWRWAGVMAREASGEDPRAWASIAPAIGAATPDSPYEAQQSFEAWLACVTARVERADDLGRRSREHFRNLWHYLRLRVLDSAADEDERWPSKRQIATVLGIPRSALGALYERLERLVIDCRNARRTNDEERSDETD